LRYRPLGKTGLLVSELAMGCMRLPEDSPDVAAQTVDEAISSGVNYFETTRGYINGRCQHLTGGGLKGRSRGLIVSGKAGVTPDTTADSYRAEIELQMQILGVDYLEFFQVGWFSLDRLELLTKKGGALEALRRAQDEGLIGHIGFTGHDTPDNFTKVIETGIFESLTIPYSILNRSYEPTIKRAGELGVGVVAMCPVAGGVLATPSRRIQELIPGGVRTTVQAALHFVLANPDVSCACSGMSSVEMVRENVAAVNSFDGVAGADWLAIQKILDDFAALGGAFCTGCRYCMDCPHGVDIPGNFQLRNYADVYGLEDWAVKAYAQMTAETRASACTQCGECEPKCPNKLPIVQQLADVARRLGQC